MTRDPVSSTSLTSWACDTVLTRAVSSPAALYLLLGRRLQLPPSPEVFARARLRAAEVAESRRGVHATLHDIYAELVWATRCQRPVDELVQAELDLELELSRPVAAVAEELTAGAADDRPVVFLADTPLSSEFLSTVLDRHGLRRAREVVVSNELGASSRLGNAYGVLARRRGVRTRDWTHSGPDAVADVRNARRAGLHAVHRPEAALTRYERLLDAHLWETAGASALLAGAARSARSGRAGSCAKQDVAAGVIGPLFGAYVLWCLAEASAAGCRRLYFCARDGQALFRLATVLAPAVAPELELRYLMGSREAWLVDASDPLRAELGHVALDDADDRLRRVARYFGAVGLLDGEPFGIVDMASRGNVGRLLGELLQRVGGQPPLVELYFAKASAEGQRAGTPRDVRGWLYDDGRARGRRHLGMEEYIALEMFATADHGKVVGYDAEGTPVLRARSARLDAWDFAPVTRTLERFAEALRDVVPLLPPHADVRSAAWAAFRLFWESPDAGELASWGAFPFEGDDGSTTAPAAPMPLRAVLASAARLRAGWRPRGAWPAGALLASPLPTRAVVRTTDRLQGRREQARQVADTVAARAVGRWGR